MVGLGVTHLGRAEDNDLVLTDIGVSRRHARILVQPGGVWIEDLGSGNGTYFQGDRIGRQVLKNGDEVMIDPFLLRFQIPQPEADTGVTEELEEVDDDDTVRVPSTVTRASPTVENPSLPRARLITLNGQRLAPSYPVRPNGLTIGRSDARDVILFDPAASRNHARLEFVGGDIWLRDDSSGNGTFVNAHRVREQCLRHGDRVRVGSTEFRFELLDERKSEPSTMPPAAVEEAIVRDHDSLPSHAQARIMEGLPKRMAVALVGLAALVLMAFIGGLSMLYLTENQLLDPVAQSVENGSEDAKTLTLGEQRKYQTHMSRGESQMREGRYLSAAAQFYAAFGIDSNSVEAQRKGSASCEYVLLDAMQNALQLRGLPTAEKESRRTKALALGRQAVNGRANEKDALAMVEEVLIFFPEDRRIAALREKLKGR